MSALPPGPDRDRDRAREELDRVYRERRPGEACSGCMGIALAGVVAVILLGALTAARLVD